MTYEFFNHYWYPLNFTRDNFSNISNFFMQNKIQLSKVRAEDAGTYICNVSNSIVSTEVPKVLVVTGVVPKFNQGPRSYIALPSLPDSYLRFNIEVSFKPEHYDGTILYNAESPDGTGDLVSLLLNDGYPEFR